MAKPTISDGDLLERALETFRSYGFEGASLSRLSEATGLEKASLYYRYPGGKDEIGMAVLGRVAAWFAKHVFAPLRGEGAARKRVQMMAEQLRIFYGNGTRSCVTDVLSLAGGSEEVRAAVKVALVAWLKAFTDIAREAGLPPGTARLRAEEAIARIEGSLVLARVLEDNAPFERAIRALPELLTEP